MKITKKVKKIEEMQEIEIGETGDFILVHAKGQGNYRFGRLEGIEEWNRGSYLKFRGDFSYHLSYSRAMGVDLPIFRPERGGYNVNWIDFVVPGIDNVIDFLESHEETAYHGHAVFIRRIRDQQTRG